MADYSDQKKFFEIAYRTGTDSWTHIPYRLRAKSIVDYIRPDSLVLDVGSGRGRFPFELVKLGYRVIGLEYVKEVVTKDNDEVRLLGISDKIRFVEGDVLDIPFTNASFDGVTDFGVLQHLDRADWATYMKEISRVTKPSAYFLSVLLSRKTPSYFDWVPETSKTGDFNRDGVSYHFFTEEEIGELANESFDVVGQRVEYISERDNIAYLVSLLKRK